jgi:hypothetical protein
MPTGGLRGDPMRKLLPCVCLATACFGQPVVAPTNVPPGSARGENIDGYNIVNSFETGYRFREVGGNLGKYRSDVNFGNGVRLLGSNLSVHSREGRGKYFDELLLNTQGLGDDPYQFSSFRVQKNRIYRYDLLWRQQDYYNPALPLAAGQHLLDTTRTLQDHSVVLLPQAPFRVFAGYSRMNHNGPGLTTVTEFTGSTGDIFPLFANIRRLQNEYRLGFELQAFGARLSVLRGWEDFRDDTRRTSGAEAGIDPADPTSIQMFRRDEPYHGSTRNWRANLLWERSKVASVSGRFTYAGTRRDFLFDESAIGTDRFGGARNRQILLFGNGRRPVTTASLTASFFPADSVTVVNHTAFHHTRMDGDGSYSELENATLDFSLVQFGYLGIRTITNTTDATVRANRAFSIFGGYQFSNRRIRSVEQSSFEGVPDRAAAEGENTLHSGRAGLRISPVKPLSIVLDGEIGRADRPFTLISERNYHAFSGRIQYKTRTLLLSVLARTNYNFNSASLLTHSARSRNYAADLSWTARPWLSFDANYSKLHLDTLTGIAYFYERRLVDTDRSLYISNIHSGYAGVRVGIGARADLFVAYSRIQDTGDGSGRIAAAPYVPGVAQEPLAPGPLGYQTFPLSFESPLARISIRLHPKIRWNAGYQHYRYAEDLLPVQNYRAHTGYTSLSWSF